MQFSLPILPFDPSVAKTAVNAAPFSRLNDPNPATSTADFGDLLPANAGVNLKSVPGDKSSPELGVAKQSNPASDDSAQDETEIAADENDQTTANDPSGNWFIANGFAQRFVAPAPHTAGTAAAPGDSIPETGEESAATVDNAGGKAVGLTQPMPAAARGEGRIRAIFNRAERKPFIAASAEQPLPPTTSNSAPTGEATSAAPTEEPPAEEPLIASSAPTTAPTEIAQNPAAPVSGLQTTIAAVSSDVPVTNGNEASASETAVAPSAASPSAPISADEPSPVTTPEDTNLPVGSTDSVTSSSAELFTSPVELTPTPTPAPVEPQPSATLPTDQSNMAVASIPTASVAANVESVGDTTPGDSAVSGKGVPSGKVFPLADSDKLSTAPGLANAAEKFAAGFERRRGISTSRGNSPEINSLSADKESVTQAQFGLGINVAKTQLAMAATATTSDLPSSLTSMTTEAVSAASALSHQAKDEPQAGSPVSAARRAVESAIAMAEHFTGVEHRGVNLQFSVSGVDLAVRVELRGDAVHTTFRTDSPELRAALAHEWQVVNAQPADRSMRLADPVFASSSNSSSAQADAGSHQQRETGARGGQFENNPFAGFRSPNRSSPAAAPRPTTIVHEADLALGRLRTFA